MALISEFLIKKMDCPSEEQLIRLKLSETPEILQMQFDIPNRTLRIIHGTDSQALLKTLHTLNLDTTLTQEMPFTEAAESIPETDRNDRKLLWQVFWINLGFFFLEMIYGWISGSTGLMADSLDMLADSFIYALSLFAIGGSIITKKKIAGIAGYIQILLAVSGMLEVLRRFSAAGIMPEFRTMIGISAMALAANALCLYLLNKSRNDEAHMRASKIFTSNDVIMNAGVIVAGLLVNWLKSPIPDLMIGAFVFILVFKGALNILSISRS